MAAGALAGALTTAAALAPASATNDGGDVGGDETADRVVPMRGARRSEMPRVVTPELVQAALEREAEAAERAMRSNPRASRAGGHRPFVRPAAGALTGWFGEPRGGRAHLGLDIDGPTGAPVVAAGPGTVVHAGGPPVGYSGYGLTVIVDHGHGVVTVYAHLSRVDAVHGDPVQAGAPVGAIGTTGSTTGSHLHFEVRVDGTLVDPAPWIDS